jgi:hypothetical protein
MLGTLFLVTSLAAYAAAPFAVLNADGPGEGLNDPTPAAPVGGNPGVTVGQQRQIALQYAASLWGATLTSTQVIRVIAFFDPLPCTASSAVLGGSSPFWFFRDFPPAPGFPGLTPSTWYPGALAEKRTGTDIAALTGLNFEVIAFFNSQMGQAGCLPTGGWYYGLDTNTPSGRTNLVTTLLHEFGHGLGFTVSPTNELTGVRPQGFPSVWEQHMLDLVTGRRWQDMTNAERAVSSVNTDNLVWTGLQTQVDVPQVLGYRSEILIQAHSGLRGDYEAQPAQFGPPLTQSGLHDILMPAYDTGGPSLTDGCEAFTKEPQKSVKGRIALIDRGACTFTQKVMNAQLAGAIAAVIANNVPAGFPTMGGVYPAITIPSVGVTQALGNALRQLPQLSNPGRGGLPVNLRLSSTIRAGTSGGFPRLYAPNPLEQGSSVSHWDTSLNPNQLMEPFLSSDLTHQRTPPQDLTFSVLRDIGW